MDWNTLAKLLADTDPEGDPYEGNESYYGEYARQLLTKVEVSTR